MRISDWSSDVCSSDLNALQQCGYVEIGVELGPMQAQPGSANLNVGQRIGGSVGQAFGEPRRKCQLDTRIQRHHYARAAAIVARRDGMASGAQRSEEHTPELQSLTRLSYAVYCLKTKQRCKLITTCHQSTP